MSSIEVKVPVLAESVAEATLVNWHKKVGDLIKEGDKLVDIETDKVVLEVTASKAGKLIEIFKENGSDVLSEEVIAIIEASTTVISEEVVHTTIETTIAESAAPKTSPAVRKLAAELGVNPATVPHTSDRVTKADMIQTMQSTTPAKVTNQPTSVTPSTTPSVTAGERPEERVPMTRLRKRVAERLLNAQHEHAILTTFNEINMKPVMDIRAKYKDKFEKDHGVKLGFMSFFVKASVAALQKFPVINASTEGDDIIYHGYYDIGIAVSSPRGLVVPILRNVDSLSFAEVEKGISEFGQRARNAQLNIDDLSGGTFTITNGGIFGSMLSTPILNPPQSAILGMHNIVERPVAENGQVVIRPVMYVALSYDHRLVDGRDAVQFLVTIKNLIEDPARLLLNV